jgi:hypothetical protein
MLHRPIRAHSQEDSFNLFLELVDGGSIAGLIERCARHLLPRATLSQACAERGESTSTRDGKHEGHSGAGQW